jgi:response regulator NasT
MRKLRVLVADDHERMRLAIVQVLSNDFKIVGVAGDGEQLVDSAISLHPDVIVTDISMPFLSGPGALQELSTRGYDIPFVFVSADPFGADEFIRQGAAFVNKCDIASELVPVIHAAALGHTYVSPTACSKTANSRPTEELGISAAL